MQYYTLQACRPRAAGGAMPPPPDFGRSVNPISTRGGGQIMPTKEYWRPLIFSPSYGPALWNKRIGHKCSGIKKCSTLYSTLSAHVKEKIHTCIQICTTKVYLEWLPKLNHVHFSFTFVHCLCILSTYILHTFGRVCFSKNNALRSSSAYTNQPSPSWNWNWKQVFRQVL